MPGELTQATLRRRMADTYSRAASRYERQILPFFLPMARSLVEALEIEAGSTALDLASGGGAVLDALEGSSPARLVAADLAPGALASARVRHPGIDYVVLDLESGLPFSGSAFDIITCSFGLNHLGDAGSAIARWKPLLKQDGRVGFTAWEESSASPLGELYDEVVTNLLGSTDLEWEPDFDRMIAESLAALRSREGIAQLLSRSGYGVVSIARHPLEFRFDSLEAYVDYRLAWGTDAEVASPLGSEASSVISDALAARATEDVPRAWTRHYYVAVAK